ncbi:hypothetical protein KI387_036880, partial [Taxus chinensis]
SLGPGTITNWDDLGTTLCNQFGEKVDNLSLLEQLTTIKRDPNELMTDFNFIFQKTWDKIPILMRPTLE